jgi:hypothetical protein
MRHYHDAVTYHDSKWRDITLLAAKMGISPCTSGEETVRELYSADIMWMA